MARVEPRLGRRVMRRLRLLGWSQREAARQAAERAREAGDDAQAVSLATVQAISAGTVVGPEKVLAIALATGEDPDRLLGLARWPFRYDPSVIAEAQASDDPERRGAVA